MSRVAKKQRLEHLFFLGLHSLCFLLMVGVFVCLLWRVEDVALGLR